MGLFDKEGKDGILSKLQRATGELFASGDTEPGNTQNNGRSIHKFMGITLDKWNFSCSNYMHTNQIRNYTIRKPNCLESCGISNFK